MHLSRFRALDFKGLLKLHFSHLRGSLRPLGGLQSQPCPLPLTPLPSPLSPQTHHFPCDLSPEDWGKDSGSRGFPLVPRPLPLHPAPTWAYPCCLLLLPILAASAPPRHWDPKTCRGPGWGAGDAAAKRSAPPRAARPEPARPRPLPPAPAAPTPALTTIFHTKKDGGGAGDPEAGVSEGSSSGATLPLPGEARRFLQTRTGPRRGSCGLCVASPRDSPIPRRAPPARSTLRTYPREPLRVPYLLPLRLLLWGLPWPARPQGHLEKQPRRMQATAGSGARARRARVYLCRPVT